MGCPERRSAGILSIGNIRSYHARETDGLPLFYAAMVVCYYLIASVPRSFVRIRTASLISDIKILPSPYSPV